MSTVRLTTVHNCLEVASMVCVNMFECKYSSDAFFCIIISMNTCWFLYVTYLWCRFIHMYIYVDLYICTYVHYVHLCDYFALLNDGKFQSFAINVSVFSSESILINNSIFNKQ